MRLEKSVCQFTTVGIIGKYGDNDDVSSTIGLVLQVIDELDANALIDRETTRNHFANKTCHKTVDRNTLVTQSDIIVAVGGDGSFLASSRSIIELSKPITGVNMGRLGFLTDISPSEIHSVLFEVLTGKYNHEARTVLSAQIIRAGQTLSRHIGINDVVIHKSSVARMVELDVYLDNRFLSSYHADGLIVSSPTGSTAYALSSGGPILQSNLEALLLVPICPHTLTQRPIVIDANTQQRIEIGKDNDNDIQVSVDGQKEIPLQIGDSVLITKYDKKLNIYHPCDYDQLRRLRHKLGWGYSPV
ncbi:MAG: NAD(+) kinase [Gammaproteobacteria bacterium]|nr:MAG: NAD(+) kinase [Gammaproteobacteria bacterium]